MNPLEQHKWKRTKCNGTYCTKCKLDWCTYRLASDSKFPTETRIQSPFSPKDQDVWIPVPTILNCAELVVHHVLMT